MSSPLLSLPFHDRRYISVISDREFDIRAKEAGEAPKPATETNSSVWPAISLLAPALMPGGILIRGILLAGGIAYTAYAANAESGNKGGKISPSRELIVEVPVRDTRDLAFSTKYAEVGRIYASNPLSSSIYYPVQTYYDDMIIHKLSELELILSALGAKKFNISYHEEALDKAGAKLKNSAAPVGGAVDVSSSRRKRFERSGTSEGKDPILPDNLTWYHHEPDWQTLAMSRLHYGRKEFSFSVELERGLELTASAVAAFKSLGFDVGADYNQNRNLTLLVSGTF